MRPFRYRRGRLEVAGVDLEALADRYGTPLYVYDFGAVEAAYRAYGRAFGGRALVCAAVKANGNLALLRHLARLGSGFDVVSGGELERVLAAGGRAERVVFSGVGKTAAEMDLGLRAGILLFNVESEPELELLAERAARLRRRARFGLRVNPNIAAPTHPHIATGLKEHKFGIAPALARRLFRSSLTQRWLEPAGVSCHIGSQIRSTAPFAAAVRAVAGLLAAWRREGVPLAWLDLGGGLGIPYRPGERAPSIAAYAAAVRRALAGAHLDPAPRLLLEPGRSLVGAAGALLTRVLYVKNSGGKRFLIADAGANDLLRPSLYGAYHEIAPLHRRPGRRRRVEVVGPLCESGDAFAQARPLPPIEAGDVLALLDAGAYGYALSSNYNGRPRPPELAVLKGRIRLVRRRETSADLLACDRPAVTA